jgi:DNA mismatch repair protein MutS2
MGLVLLDELGTGTDPKEGAALGAAVLQALSRRGCWVLASTHLGEISQWALRHAKFQNASVQFDEERLAPTYRLLVGMPGQSRALTIAAKLGLPSPVLQDAEKRLGRREQDWREFLRQLEAERLRLMEESDALATREAKVGKDQKILQEREERLRHQQEKFQQDSREKVQRVLDFIDHESKRLVKELKVKQREQADADRVGTEAHERVKTIRQIAETELKSTAAPPKPTGNALPLKEGSYARHKNLGVEGKLVALQGRKATLETSTGRRLEAELAELESLTGVQQDVAPRTGRVRFRAESHTIESELNLIGRASDDIEFDVTRFLEAALSAGYRFIRIVHGHGTGRLKAAVREALRGHPSIAKVEDAPQAQGGAGATVITLR